MEFESEIYQKIAQQLRFKPVSDLSDKKTAKTHYILYIRLSF